MECRADYNVYTKRSQIRRLSGGEKRPCTGHTKLKHTHEMRHISQGHTSKQLYEKKIEGLPTEADGRNATEVNGRNATEDNGKNDIRERCLLT